MSQNRYVMLVGEITTKSIAKAMERMLELISEDSGPIILLINSEGGSQGEAMSFYDFIRSLGVDVIGVVCGVCYSSATVVWQACHKRYITKSSCFMLHEGFIENQEETVTYQQTKKDLRAMLKQERILRKYLAERSGKTVKEIIRLEKRVTYMGPDETLLNGFADGIVTGPFSELGNIKKSRGRRGTR